MKKFGIILAVLAVLAVCAAGGAYFFGNKNNEMKFFQISISDKGLDVFTLSQLELVSNGNEAAVTQTPRLIARDKEVSYVSLELKKGDKVIYDLSQSVLFGDDGKQLRLDGGNTYYDKPRLKKVELNNGDSVTAMVTVSYKNNTKENFSENIKLKDSFVREQE